MCLVEIQHQRVVILKVAGRDPAALLGAVAGPVGQILKSSAEDARVKDARDLMLLLSFGVDDGWGWGWDSSGWQGVWVVGFEEGGVENRVDTHG